MDRRLEELLARILGQEEEEPQGLMRRGPVQTQTQTQTQEPPPPFPFPMRGPVQDWERRPPGSVIGAAVGSYRPPPQTPAPPQRNRFAERMDEYANVIPWQGLGDTAQYIGGQLARAPGRLVRGEPLNTPPPNPEQPFQPPLGAPSAYLPPTPPPAPFPFPIYRPGSTGTPFADVQDTGPPQREPPPQRTPYMASRFAPPSAMTPQEEARTIAEAESAAWQAAIERARRLRGSRSPLPTLEEIQRREEGAALAVRGYDPARGGTRRGRGGGGGGDQQERGGGW